MPTRKRKKNEVEFHESLAPTLPFGLVEEAEEATLSPRRAAAQFLGLGLVAIAAGILIGLVIRAHMPVAEVQVAPGSVAAVTAPPFDRILAAKIVTQPGAITTNLQVVSAQPLTGLAISLPQDGTISSTASNLLPAVGANSYQPTEGINTYQSVLSAYGMQGGIGTKVAR